MLYNSSVHIIQLLLAQSVLQLHIKHEVAGCQVSRLYKQSVGDADGAECVGAEQPNSTANVAVEAPTMPTLQRMHEIGANHPALTAQFFLLQEELSYRHHQGTVA